jgi:hypothetical protein
MNRPPAGQKSRNSPLAGGASVKPVAFTDRKILMYLDTGEVGKSYRPSVCQISFVDGLYQA